MLPIVQRLGASQFPKAAGRSPQVIVLAPTRELAKQVLSEVSLMALVHMAMLSFILYYLLPMLAGDLFLCMLHEA